MKIEKVNDHQIRCTLTKADLADRELKLSELAYGTEKAKSLFRDMMQQAAFEFGFEAEDIPLMIEAIPISSDCIVLVITKVEDPEELDTRFSKFAPSLRDNDGTGDDSVQSITEGADDILDLFRKIHEGKSKTSDNDESDELASSKVSNKQAKEKAKEILTSDDISITVKLTKLYSFPNIVSLIKLSKVLESFYMGENSLYKDKADSNYILILSKGSHSPEEFNKICNIVSEYGNSVKSSSAGKAYVEEHMEAILPANALQSLAKVK